MVFLINVRNFMFLSIRFFSVYWNVCFQDWPANAIDSIVRFKNESLKAIARQKELWVEPEPNALLSLSLTGSHAYGRRQAQTIFLSEEHATNVIFNPTQSMTVYWMNRVYLNRQDWYSFFPILVKFHEFHFCNRFGNISECYTVVQQFSEDWIARKRCSVTFMLVQAATG